MLKNQKDFAAGLMYLAFGGGALATLGSNELGTLARMGPGYFPAIIGTCLAVVGLILMLRAVFCAPVSPEDGRLHFGKPFSALLILGSAAFYALTLLKLGFVLSIGIMVFVSSLAHPAFKLRDALISAVFLTALTGALFVGGLGLIVPLWPTFL